MSCVKCGHWGANEPTYHEHCAGNPTEHLHYTCSRCGYGWTGPTRDQNARQTLADARRAAMKKTP